MKQLLISFGLLACFVSNAQSISTIFQKRVDPLNYHQIQDVQLNAGNIYILGSTKEDEIKSEHYLLTKVNFDGEIISQYKIESGRFDFLNGFSISPTGFVITGGTWNQDDEGMTDFIAFYDFELNLIWQRKLENKWEGKLAVVTDETSFVAATNNNSGIQVYRLDSDGRTLNKERIPSMNSDNLFELSDSNFLLVTLTLDSKGDSQKELLTLTPEFKILNKSILPIKKKDYLKNIYFPDPIKLLNNEKIVAMWSGKPPMTTFSSTADTTFQTVKHTRHDISFFDIEMYKNNTYIYSGKLGKQAAIFVIEENKIINKVTFGDMGTWSSNELFRISDSDYVLVTDKIRTNDFETNIEIIRIRIE